MPKRISLPLGALLMSACILPALAASPTPDQVYQALRGGDLAAAQQMMTQVLRDHPQSGRAHFVAAEVDARARNYDLARQELRTAKSLDPTLAVQDPRGVSELQQQLGETPVVGVLAQQTVRPRHPSRLGLFLILVGAAVVLWLVLRRRAAAMGYPQYPGQYPGGVPPGPGGYGPGGYPGGGYPGGYMPGGGPGIMGSVASGLALGAGVAAGEELVRHVIGGGSNAGAGGFVPPAEAGQLPDPNADMGGNDFGLNDPGSGNDGSGGGWDDGGGGGDGGGWT
ncbi:MAG TPA: tetratricopeptide repeat protein [Steroidobacteraceae bacterium]|jgi:hypothetical protein|nr:tetratricopeptide repeat protein [Steroidobacteraceae bacterium]